MLKLIILLTLATNFNYALSDPSPQEASSTAVAYAYASSSSSGGCNEKKCGENQVYDRCPSSCPPRTCETKDIAFDCLPPLKPGHPKCPRPKCRCADNYYSNDEGECVPKDQCPKKCGANEIFYTCPEPNTGKRTCDEIDDDDCYTAPSDYPCIGECRCKPGYYRNKIGECISKEECKKCPGKYEYFSCGSACDNECDKLSTQNRTNCPIVNIQCNKMCYCLDGYARDANKKCIPISQCPPQCKKNEEYSECPGKVCREQSCKDLGFPLPCLQSGGTKPKCGKPACICKVGFVRNNKGICVPSRECPSCGGDPNAWSGCGTFCTRCSNYKDKDRPCILICKSNSCDCRPGFVYDEVSKTCIRPEKCPPKCGPHEVHSKCANDPCIKNCKTKDLNLPCKGNPASCKPGCVCVNGYFRNDKGVCVPKDKCPPNNPKCQKNEEYSDCPNKVCRPKKCTDLGFPLKCNDTKKCCGKPTCICKSGFVRNKHGVCIDSKNCPSCGGDPNAWPGCGTFCKRCSNYNDEVIPCPKSCKQNACECRPGYVYYAKKEKCVLPEECPVCDD